MAALSSRTANNGSSCGRCSLSHAFVAFHWPGSANELTSADTLDPHSKMPAYKSGGVRALPLMDTQSSDSPSLAKTPSQAALTNPIQPNQT